MDPTLKLIKKYFDLTSQQELERIRNNEILNRNLNLEQKKAAYIKYKSLIEKHSKMFKRLVIARNELAKQNGFSNFFDYIANWDGIPDKYLKKLEANIESSAKKYSSYFIKLNNKPDYIYTKYNSLDMSWIADSSRFNMPEDVVLALEKKYNKLKGLKSKIEYKHRAHRYYQAQYKNKAKKVVIVYDKTDKEVNSAIILAHEIGHAINYLDMYKKGLNPDDRVNFDDEKKAIDAEKVFVKSLPHRTRQASYDRILYHFAKTLFEKKVYQNPGIDFSKAYAQSINQVFPIKDKTNPFYVLDTSFITDPCYSTIYTALYIS